MRPVGAKSDVLALNHAAIAMKKVSSANTMTAQASSGLNMSHKGHGILLQSINATLEEIFSRVLVSAMPWRIQLPHRRLVLRDWEF